MNDATFAIIKATIPVLREHGVAITSRMYERMLFCGPNEFMAAVDRWLAELGVDARRRHYECFGPRDATSWRARSAAA